MSIVYRVHLSMNIFLVCYIARCFKCTAHEYTRYKDSIIAVAVSIACFVDFSHLKIGREQNWWVRVSELSNKFANGIRKVLVTGIRLHESILSGYRIFGELVIRLRKKKKIYYVWLSFSVYFWFFFWIRDLCGLLGLEIGIVLVSLGSRYST